MVLTPVRSEYEQMMSALYGDGAWELVVSKRQLSAEEAQKKRERTQARVGLATNVVGLAAGTAGLLAASRLPALRRVGATTQNAGPLTGRLAPKLKSSKAKARLIQAGAAGAVGLQGANLAGDAIANRVLARASKDETKKKVAKGFNPADKATRQRRRLQAVATAAGAGATAGALTQIELERKKVKKSSDLDFTIRGEISKSNDKRQVFGWASVVELNGQPVVDLQGDYMAIEVIEKAAYDYVHSSRRGGDMHQEGSHASDLIESFIVTPEKKQQLGLPEEMPVGWWVGFQVHDDKVWQMVKDGKRPEFSIHGSGQRVDVEI